MQIIAYFPNKRKEDFIMNKETINEETMEELFEIFTDEILAGKISYDDYLPKFRENTGVTENSPYELMYRGFIGGLYIASCVTEDTNN